VGKCGCVKAEEDSLVLLEKEALESATYALKSLPLHVAFKQVNPLRCQQDSANRHATHLHPADKENHVTTEPVLSKICKNLLPLFPVALGAVKL
jgi:hypothetical protein